MVDRAARPVIISSMTMSRIDLVDKPVMLAPSC
jgi:hypothetical protein